MNKIKFQDPNSGRDFFLPSATSLQFFGEIVELVQKFALLGGNNYILNGCDVSNGNVNSGYIVYNGELFYFAGAVLPSNARLHITEYTSGEEVYNNNVQTGARLTRALTLATDGNTNYLFSSLKRIQVQNNLLDRYLPYTMRKLLVDVTLTVTYAGGLTQDYSLFGRAAVNGAPDSYCQIAISANLPNISPFATAILRISVATQNMEDVFSLPDVTFSNIVLGDKTFVFQSNSGQLMTYILNGDTSTNAYSHVVGNAIIFNIE